MDYRAFSCKKMAWSIQNIYKYDSKSSSILIFGQSKSSNSRLEGVSQSLS